MPKRRQTGLQSTHWDERLVFAVFNPQHTMWSTRWAMSTHSRLGLSAIASYGKGAQVQRVPCVSNRYSAIAHHERGRALESCMSRFVWVACVLAVVGLANSAQAQAPTQPAIPPAPPAAPAIATPKSAPAVGDRLDKATPPKAAAANPTSPTKPADANKAADAKKPVGAVGQPNCTRLPLSDIQFTQEKTTEVARMRLGEYAQKVATQRGWKSFRKSDETVSCEVYLYLGPLGTEYKCLVTATFCPGPGVTSAAKSAPGQTAAPVAKTPAVAVAPTAAPALVAAKPAQPTSTVKAPTPSATAPRVALPKAAP
jgi:hypothetical protein